MFWATISYKFRGISCIQLASCKSGTTAAGPNNTHATIPRPLRTYCMTQEDQYILNWPHIMPWKILYFIGSNCLDVYYHLRKLAVLTVKSEVFATAWRHKGLIKIIYCPSLGGSSGLICFGETMTQVTLTRRAIMMLQFYHNNQAHSTCGRDRVIF